eukprot:COSAG06_NODE_1188_length_10329_cov_4.747875_5_plen_45_part_00
MSAQRSALPTTLRCEACSAIEEKNSTSPALACENSTSSIVKFYG